MTIVNTEARLGMATQRLPRVNLLPPEIAENARLRKVQMGLGAGVVAAVGVVGLLFVSASHSEAEAQNRLDAANQQTQQLNRQMTAYANVTKTYAAAAAAQVQLTSAMGQEVRYSQILHDLSLSVPSTVWLKSLTYTQSSPAASSTSTTPAGSTTTAAAGGRVTSPALLGTMQVTGIGFSHNDLALWLESLATQKSYSDAYFSSSSEALLGTRKIVNFTSTANLTSAALSGRYTKPTGG